MNLAEVGLTVFSQEISRTLFSVFCSPLAAISVDLKASALTNKQQCSSGQPHSRHWSRSQISQYQNNSREVGGCFHHCGAGSSCFPFTVTGQTPTFMRHSFWFFCPDVCPKTFVMGACSKYNTLRLSAGEMVLFWDFVWCL